MNTQIFLNLPVADLAKSREFFKALGYSFNEQFSDDTAACVVISEHIYVMILTHAKFCEFSPNPICDTAEATEVLIALSCESREELEELVKKAVAAGGSTYAEPKDYGFMIQHSFRDLDGHCWELVYMEPGADCPA